MDFIDFLREMLGITSDFAITSIVKDEDNKHIKIHLQYLNAYYEKDGKTYKLYDKTPEREWQHLNWFDYRCYLVSSLPRYISDDGKPKVIDINFAPKSKGYTVVCLNLTKIISFKIESGREWQFLLPPAIIATKSKF